MERREQIIQKLKVSEQENLRKMGELHRRVSLVSYQGDVRSRMENGEMIHIWTEALQKALIENEIVEIPASNGVYYIDNTVIVPSNRRIIADNGAHIRLTADTDVLMLRNQHTHDGTHAAISGEDKDCNISIEGGVWEESNTQRRGYGASGKYGEDSGFYGVSTCMFFCNMENLTLKNMVFAHTAGFAVQMGNVKNVICKHIRFRECYADGLHINGNTENLLIQDVSGQVGDDLVALNAYDWQNSSVNFGFIRTVYADKLVLAEGSRCKAFRIQPGIYDYADGTKEDCFIRDIIIRGVRGICTFKMYFQTPRYLIGTTPEKGEPGNADYIYFEDIKIDLNTPVDRMKEYMQSDPVRGTFAAFEIGSNIGRLYLTDIEIVLHRDIYPMSYLLCVGPKSCLANGYEIFDPYVNSKVEHITAANIKVNGEIVQDLHNYMKEIQFENVNGDGNSTGAGRLGEVCLQNFSPRTSYEDI